MAIGYRIDAIDAASKEIDGAQLSFVGELARLRTDCAISNLDAWVRRFQARPAYKAAIAGGGRYSFAS